MSPVFVIPHVRRTSRASAPNRSRAWSRNPSRRSRPVTFHWGGGGDAPRAAAMASRLEEATTSAPGAGGASGDAPAPAEAPGVRGVPRRARVKSRASNRKWYASGRNRPSFAQIARTLASASIVGMARCRPPRSSSARLHGSAGRRPGLEGHSGGGAPIPLAERHGEALEDPLGVDVALDPLPGDAEGPEARPEGRRR